MAIAPSLTFEAALRWHSDEATHCDRCYVDVRDAPPSLLPPALIRRLANAQLADAAAREVVPGALFPSRDENLRRTVRDEQFRRPQLDGLPLEPRVGRFYPRSLLGGAVSTLPQDCQVFRCLECGSGQLELDFNDPLAGRTVSVELRPTDHTALGRASAAPGFRGLCGIGPGMQAPLPILPTDFIGGDPFARQDANSDANFYQSARLVDHLDATARAQLRSIYGRLLEPGMVVLDLMSSWNSHLPDALDDLCVTGLGMNAEELRCNRRLSRRVVHDLNHDPELPFADESFDAAICTVSLEYLTQPVDVLRSVARVLKPKAPIGITFSERWFPPKVIRIWTELHPFERVAFVLDMLRRSAGFTAFASESVRGLPRPREDKYAATLAHSDPIYAVWGIRRSAVG